MTLPTFVPGAASKLTPSSSADLSQGLAATAGVLGTVQGPNGPIPVVASINDCLTKLASSLASVSSFASDDDNAAKQIFNVIAKPFDELGTALAQLLLPDPNAADTSSFGGLISSVGSQLASALTNPFLAIINQQGAVLESSFDQIKAVLFSGDAQTNGFFVDYFNQAKTAVKTLFLSPTNTDGNLAGIFLYAFEHGVPAIEAELAYLKAMRDAYTGVIEEASSIPAQLNIELPNNSVIAKLCDAEIALGNTASRLRFDAVFDRTLFNRASDDVCSAKDLIFDGKFDSDLLKTHSADFLGVAGIKTKDLANLRFLPDVAFKLRLQELVTLANLYNTQESAVTQLYKNILAAESSIASLVSVNSGDIVAMLVDVLHKQITSLRRQLQTQGGGTPPTSSAATDQANLTAHITANGLTQTQATQLAQNQYRGYQPYAAPAATQHTDISTYLSSQAATYLMLVNLCTLMERAQYLYQGIDQVVNFETNLMKELQSLIRLFAIESCGPPDTGVQVEQAVTNFLTTAVQRLNNTTRGIPSNEPLRRSALALDTAIRNREQFLNCMLGALTFGIGRLQEALALVSSGYALFTNIRQMVRNFPDLEKQVKALNLKNLLGVNGQEYSALESLLQAVQCLLLNCNNPLVQSIGEDLLSTFQTQLERRGARSLNMASFDQVPTIAATARSNNRLNQIFRVISAIETILNLDVNALCGAQSPAAQAALNQQRTTGTGAAFCAAPGMAVQPSNTPNTNVAPSAAVQQLSQATVVNMPIYSAPAQAQPGSLTPSAGTAFSQ